MTISPFLLIFLCLHNAFDCFVHFSYIPFEWYLLWSSVHVVNHLSFGFNWIVWIYRILCNLIEPLNKKKLIGGVGIIDMIELDPKHDHSRDPEHLYLNNQPIQIMDMCFLGFLFIVMLAWPSVVRFFMHKWNMKYNSIYKYYHNLISKYLLAYKYTSNCEFLTYFHRMQALTQCTHLIINYSLLCMLHIWLLNDIMFQVAWAAIWCEYFIYVQMIYRCLLVDLSVVGKRYNTFFDRMVAHFWSIHLELINNEKYVFGSIYWTFYNLENKRHLIMNNTASNKDDDDDNKHVKSWKQHTPSMPILYWPWINYGFTYFTPTLMEVQTKYEKMHSSICNVVSAAASSMSLDPHSRTVVVNSNITTLNTNLANKSNLEGLREGLRPFQPT